MVNIDHKIGAKEALAEKNFFSGSMNKVLRKRLIKCFLWSIVLYGAEIWTLRKSEKTIGKL